MLWLLATTPLALAQTTAVFESGASRPLALSADGDHLWVTNLPEGRLERLDLTRDPPVLDASVPVGIDPIAVAIHGDQAWVVNHVSDTVSTIDLAATPPRVSHTLWVGDDPGDVVVAGDRVFITAAQRGQALADVDLQPGVPGLPRADVWVFDATDPTATPQRLSLMGDTPRAMAVSPDGDTLYVAVYRSGNGTAVVPESLVCDGGSLALACSVDGKTMPGGLPAPNDDADGLIGPETGLIVRHDGTGWRDPRGDDWSEALGGPPDDHDVFVLDVSGPEVLEVDRISGVGTILFSMAVDDVGDLWVANTDGNNHVRFEGDPAPGRSSVRGHIHPSRLTHVSQGMVSVIDLNPHLDLALSTEVAPQSLAQPVSLALHDGRAWVAGYGTGALLSEDLDTLRSGSVSGASDRLVQTAFGPRGLLSDPARDLIYVYTRFSHGVEAIDPATGASVWRVPLTSPEDPGVITGRALFFDAKDYGNAATSCGSCHVDGHQDGLVWDLGNPDAVTVQNPNPQLPGDAGATEDFHPLKGPMRTQTMRGVANTGALHWRGDRIGGADPTQAGDSALALLEFDGAFDTLLGGDPAEAAAVDFVVDWSLAMRARPNPWLPLDGVPTADQQQSLDSLGPAGCLDCHFTDPDAGLYGTDGSVTAAHGTTQLMKVAGLRNAHDAVGAWLHDGTPERLWPTAPRTAGLPLRRAAGHRTSGDLGGPGRRRRVPPRRAARPDRGRKL